MREYKIAQGPTAGGDDVAECTIKTLAKIEQEHFAVRTVYAPAPWGEGYIDAAVLDHMPSGRKCFGGSPIAPMSAEMCAAFAASLASMPVDWSARKPESPPDHGEFIARARAAAERGESVKWGE